MSENATRNSRVSTGRALKLLVFPTAILTVFILLLVGCSGQNPVQTTDLDQTKSLTTKAAAVGTGYFTLEAKYSFIMSCPGGGGIIPVRLVPGDGFTGDVNVTVTADKKLGVTLSATVINAADPVVEILFNPSMRINIDTFYVTLTATNGTGQQSVQLTVNVVSASNSVPVKASETRDMFIAWLEANHPELGSFTGEQWFDSWPTYPGIMIVEHYTHLSYNWEFRVCYHVMIPPYDWSKMLLRGRGVWDPVIAVIREWDDTVGDYVIHEMPVEDYPVIYGY